MQSGKVGFLSQIARNQRIYECCARHCGSFSFLGSKDNFLDCPDEHNVALLMGNGDMFRHCHGDRNFAPHKALCDDENRIPSRLALIYWLYTLHIILYT